jgi:hypothetical protein
MNTREDTPLLRPNVSSLAPYNTESQYGRESIQSSTLELQYLLLMVLMGGVTGLTTFSITTLAENCGTSALSLGIIFMFQAIGSLIGGGLSVWLYSTFYNNMVLLYSGLFLSFLFLYVPNVTSLSVLCAFFTWLGCFHIIIQIGCITSLRKAHPHQHIKSPKYSTDVDNEGSVGGYWIGLSQLAVAVGALLFVFICSSGVSISLSYYTLCVSLTIISAMMITYVNPEDKVIDSIPQTERYSYDHDGNEEEEVCDEQQENTAIPIYPSHYRAEILIGLSMCLLNGMSLSVSTYLETFADESAAESITVANYQVTIFWLAVCIGRLIGVMDQFELVSRENIVLRISGWSFASCVCALFWFGFPYTLDSIWVCVVLMGFLFGPTIGYCLDLLHRITLPTTASTALALMVMNVGGFIVVYIGAIIWNAGAGALTLVYVSFITLLLSTPFVWFARGISYIPEPRPLRKQEPYLRPFY